MFMRVKRKPVAINPGSIRERDSDRDSDRGGVGIWGGVGWSGVGS